MTITAAKPDERRRSRDGPPTAASKRAEKDSGLKSQKKSGKKHVIKDVHRRRKKGT